MNRATVKRRRAPAWLALMIVLALLGLTVPSQAEAAGHGGQARWQESTSGYPTIGTCLGCGDENRIGFWGAKFYDNSRYLPPSFWSTSRGIDKFYGYRGEDVLVLELYYKDGKYFVSSCDLYQDFTTHGPVRQIRKIRFHRNSQQGPLYRLGAVLFTDRPDGFYRNEASACASRPRDSWYGGVVTS